MQHYVIYMVPQNPAFLPHVIFLQQMFALQVIHKNREVSVTAK